MRINSFLAVLAFASLTFSFQKSAWPVEHVTQSIQSGNNTFIAYENISPAFNEWLKNNKSKYPNDTYDQLKSRFSEEYSKEVWRKQDEERLKHLWSAIKFYGKVVDQENTPVADANIMLSVQYYAPNGEDENEKDYTVKTDLSGNFEISDKGHILWISSIKKAGFEGIRGGEYVYADAPVKELFKPDKDKPVIFKIRKRCAQSYVIDRDFSFNRKQSVYDISLLFIWVNRVGECQCSATWEDFKRGHDGQPRCAETMMSMLR